MLSFSLMGVLWQPPLLQASTPKYSFVGLATGFSWTTKWKGGSVDSAALPRDDTASIGTTEADTASPNAKKILPSFVIAVTFTKKLRSITLWTTPKGLNPKAQGCVLATLGLPVVRKCTPKGFHLSRRRCNAFGVSIQLAVDPGLRVRNPGLWDLTPSG